MLIPAARRDCDENAHFTHGMLSIRLKGARGRTGGVLRARTEVERIEVGQRNRKERGRTSARSAPWEAHDVPPHRLASRASGLAGYSRRSIVRED